MSIALSAILIAGLLGQAPEMPPMFKEFSGPMTYYYKSPDPTLGPKMLKALLSKENLEHPFFAQNPHVLALIAAQLGHIAAGKPKIVREYEAAFPDALSAGRKVIVQALAICGDKETNKTVDGWLSEEKYVDIRSELKDLKKQLEDPQRKGVRDRPATTPDDLDLLWCDFFVSGEYAPVARILDVFDLPDAKENEVLKRVARWSLGSNLQQHPKLVELVRKNADSRPKQSRKVVDELIVPAPRTEIEEK
jgi:hypothetical protein